LKSSINLLRFIKKNAGIAIILLSILMVIYGIWNARDHKVYHIDIPVNDLAKEVRIFHVPDIHLWPFRGKKSFQKIIANIEQLKPDFILLNGDLVDGQEGLDQDTLELLQQVKYPMYFTSGNHDTYVDLQKVKDLLTQYGVKVLNNEIINTHGIQLIGLDYMNADDDVYDAHASSRKETIKSVLQNLKINPKIPSVIVHHSPAGIKYMNEAGADLVLSGHTHAGQIFPATLIAKIQFPYLKGLYKYKDTFVYVSQGVGTFGPPMRIGTEGEATLVRLVHSKNEMIK
jgi:predicted MPP superfamily phosphohydrolase